MHRTEFDFDVISGPAAPRPTAGTEAPAASTRPQPGTPAASGTAAGAAGAPAK